MKLRMLALALVSSVCIRQVVFAELRAYEGFDFNGPAIAGQGSGFGWNEDPEVGAVAWINTAGNFQFITDDGVSLDSDAFPFTPVGNRIQTPNTDRGAEAPAARILATPFPLNQDGQLFMSFLIQKQDSEATTGNNLEISLQSAATHRARFGSTSDNRFFLTTTSSAAQGQTREENHAFGETYFAVMKVIASATASHQVFASFYDESSGPPTAEPSEWHLMATAASQVAASIDRVRIAAGRYAWGALDEIRIGTTFADVTGASAMLQGDFNGDSKVDAADYAVWRKELGDGTSYSQWQANFGATSGGSGAAILRTSVVPEPNVAILLALGLMYTAMRVRLCR